MGPRLAQFAHHAHAVGAHSPQQLSRRKEAATGGNELVDKPITGKRTRSGKEDADIRRSVFGPE
jgi:hypothetical protein